MGVRIKEIVSKIKKIIFHLKKIYIEIVNTISGSEINGSTRPPIKSATTFGGILLLSFLLIFGLWSVLATLETAAMAPGKVIVATKRKSIQHLEGGIVKKILVHEGSVVKMGDLLIKLDDTQAKATFSLLHNQINTLLATRARLIAERDNAKVIQFPAELTKEQNLPDVQKLLEVQSSLFYSEQKTNEGQVEILQQRVSQLNKQIESFQAQVISSDTQLKLIQKELDAILVLDKKGMIEKPRLWALQREAAKLTGDRDQITSQIAQTEQKIGETQQQSLTFKDGIQKEILDKLSEVESKLLDISERVMAAKDILNRTNIISPQAGTVVDLQVHTLGGVISAGKPLLDIVPSQDQLIIEAHINPLDIDTVRPGLEAKVRLSAFKSRSTPWVDGVVDFVSADVFEDPQSRQSFYTAHVIVSVDELKQLHKVKLYPGMPVEVMIITAKRTPLNYFFAPLTESFSRAFKEQ